MFSKDSRPIDNKRDILAYLGNKGIQTESLQIQMHHDNSFKMASKRDLQEIKDLLLQYFSNLCTLTFFDGKNDDCEISLHWIENIEIQKQRKHTFKEVTDEEIYLWLIWHHEGCPKLRKV